MCMTPGLVVVFLCPISPLTCNDGDSCKPPSPAAISLFGAPASATFSGAGNEPRSSQSKSLRSLKPQCKRGFVKKHSKCVKKKRDEDRVRVCTPRGGGTNASVTVWNAHCHSIDGVHVPPQWQPLDCRALNSRRPIRMVLQVFRPESHPYELTTSFILNPLVEERPEVLVTEGSLKDVKVELPPGFVGNPEATPRCTYQEFTQGEGADSCPDDTAVGAETSYTIAGGSTVEEKVRSVSSPVYNIEPSPGIPAELGFKVKGIVPILLDASVRTGGDYGLTFNAPNINEAAEIYGDRVTIWGVPADPSHDSLRGEMPCTSRTRRHSYNV